MSKDFKESVVLLDEPFKPNVELMRSIADGDKTVSITLLESELERIRQLLFQKFEYYQNELWFSAADALGDDSAAVRLENLRKHKEEIEVIFNKIFAPEKIRDIVE